MGAKGLKIGNEWDTILAEEMEKPYYGELERFLDEEYENHTIFPPRDEIFTAFRYTPYNDVKVLLLGQDPYHEKGQAHGMAFSVKKLSLIHIYTNKQLSLFNDFYEELAGCGINVPMLCIANSAAIMDYPKTHFDAVRPGIILYGCYPSEEVDKTRLDLKPVMSVKAYIIHIKTVPAGTSISYGRRFIADRESKICLLYTSAALMRSCL